MPSDSWVNGCSLRLSKLPLKCSECFLTGTHLLRFKLRLECFLRVMKAIRGVHISTSNHGLKKIEALPVGERQVSGSNFLGSLTDEACATSRLTQGITLLHEVILKGNYLRVTPKGVLFPETVLRNEELVGETCDPPRGVTTDENTRFECVSHILVTKEHK